jgi:peptidase E
MNRIFQCSLVITCNELDGVKTACPIENKNILRELKDVKSISHLLFVCSNPTVFDKTDLYAPLTREAFELSGIPVKDMTILDSRTDKNMAELVKNSDVIFLAGGVTPIQMEYFKKINLTKELHKYNDKIIIGQSAGAMNLAKVVYNSPEIYEMQDTVTTYYEGLGFSDINIEPHFDINEKEYIDTLVHYIYYNDNAYTIERKGCYWYLYISTTESIQYNSLVELLEELATF